MKALANIFLAIGVISLIMGIFSKLTLTPIAILPGGLSAQAFLLFANTCLLLCITLILLQKK